MTEAQEVRARAKALRERREELEKALEGAAGPGARPLRLELARVKEELVDCARRLKELMPSHKVRCRTTGRGWTAGGGTTFSTRPGPSWRAPGNRTAPRSWTTCAWPSGWPGSGR